MPPGRDATPALQPVRVRMGDLVVLRREQAPYGLSICGLGSCVAVFIYEKQLLRVGGMAHVLLPEPTKRSPLTSPGKFAPTAVAALVDRMLQHGVRRDHLIAKVAGGAHMFAFSAPERETLGERNIRATLEALDREGIELIGMDVGGSSGRTVLASISTGIVRITSLKRQLKEL